MEKYTADRLVTINVDVQNDFMPGGSLAVPNGDEVITPLNAINAYTRQHNGLVIATGDQHPLNTPHFGPDAWPIHCVSGTPGAALDTRLDIEPTDALLDKGMGQTDGYSAFEGVSRDGRTLEQIITPVGRERVAGLIGGVATEYCVLNTVLDATKVDQLQGDLRVYVIEDAIRGINEADVTQAIKKMKQAGAIIIRSTDVLNGQLIEVA